MILPILVAAAFAAPSAAAPAAAPPACVYRGDVPVDVRTLEPREIGAAMRRTGGSPRIAMPYVGRARLEGAFSLAIGGSRRVKDVRFGGVTAVTLVLTTGERLALMPVTAGASSRLSVKTDRCNAPVMQPQPEGGDAAAEPPPPRPRDLPRRFTHVAASRYPLYAAWSDPRANETLVYSYRGREHDPVVAVALPVQVRAMDWMPDPHGVLDELLLVGEARGRTVLVDLTVFRQPPSFLAP